MKYMSKFIGYGSIGGCILLRSGLLGTKVYDIDMMEQDNQISVSSVKVSDFLFFDILYVQMIRKSRDKITQIDKSFISLFPTDVGFLRGLSRY
jgi:hypothetical protein